MASAYELHDSRVGTVRGVFGMPRAFTRWRVTTDSVNDDPVLTLDDYVPLGAEHPYGGSYALEYYELQRMTDTEYLYEVSYGPPLYIPGVDWTITIDTALETETVLIDHRGNPIGPRQYIPDGVFKNADSSDDLPPNVESAANYRTVTPTGLYLLLHRVNDESARRVEGLERTRTVQQVFFDITVTIVSPNADVVSETYVNTVNSGTFRGRKAGTVKCLGTTIVQRAGVIAEGQPVTGRVFDVRVAFAVSPNGWQPERMVDTFKHEDGTVTHIKTLQGESVYTDYYPYATSDFERLLQLFAAPTRRIAGR